MNCRVCIYLFCFCLSAGFAQQQSASPPPAPNRHIVLDVVVTDKSGTPIPGLQQQDFTLLDNKQPQKILSFEAVQRGDAVQGAAAQPDPPVEVILLVDEVNTTFTNVSF